MKKFILLIVLFMFMGLNANAATLSTAIAKYKRQNYVGCMGDLNDILAPMSKEGRDPELANKILAIASKYDIEKITAGNFIETTNLYEDLSKATKFRRSDSEKLAYIFYYYALSLHQIGADSGRVGNYYNAAIVFSPNSKIGEYSRSAKTCLSSPDACKASDMDEFIRSGKTVSDDIIREQLLNDLKKHQDNINSGRGYSWLPKTENELAWADAGIIPEVTEEKTSSSNSNVPTDEEIGRAVRTLQRAGINPMGYANSMQMNNEYAQLNALLNSGNGNQNSNDYASMMMMMNGGQNLSPEVMQTLMRQQMMSGYGSF